ncbi:MAG TPA: cytochrome c biogenesis protein CcdA [Streptosporangiaceae bacterium]
MSIGHLVLSGPLLLAMPVAAAAGAVTFLSPCCLPLVPGFVSFVTGMAGASTAPAGTDSAPAGVAAVATSGALTRTVSSTSSAPAATLAPAAVLAPPAPPRTRVVAGTVLFVLGFSLVFVTWGAAFGGLGTLVRSHERTVTQVLGGVSILLGLLFAGAFDRFSFAGRIVKPAARPRAGLAGAPLLGLMFGLGWTPCSGPTLSTVLTMSEVTGTAARGALLAFVYALGLGVPFILVSFGAGKAMRMFAFARRHARLIMIIGGAMLVCVGVLEVTGAWFTFVAWVQAHWFGYEPPI